MLVERVTISKEGKAYGFVAVCLSPNRIRRSVHVQGPTGDIRWIQHVAVLGLLSAQWIAARSGGQLLHAAWYL